MKIYKAYKYRLYPTEEQKVLIHKTFGCSRFVYNHYLDYENKNGVKKAYDLIKDLKELEKEYEYLKEVDSCALRCAVFDLEDAFNNFFAKRSNYPNFKSKFARQSYRTSCIRSTYKGKEYSNIELNLLTRNIKLPKLGKVKIRGYRNKKSIDGRIINATVSKETTNKYYVSVLVEEELLVEKVTPASIVGIDLGIKDLVITSDGIYLKTKEKIARVHTKIKNYRKHYLNKIANEIVDEHDIIVTEDLKVKDMFKGKVKAFNKTLSDASFSKLCSLIEWKSKLKGKFYYKINTYYPSSQICSCCGYRNRSLKDLSIREYDCSCCGSHNDRDINASLNIMFEGLKIHYNLQSLV